MQWQRAANRIAVGLVPVCPIDLTEDVHLLPNPPTTVDGNFQRPRIPLNPSIHPDGTQGFGHGGHGALEDTLQDGSVAPCSGNPPNLANKLDRPSKQRCGDPVLQTQRQTDCVPEQETGVDPEGVRNGATKHRGVLRK